MDAKQLNGRIKSLAKKTAKWRDDVQLCLVGCVYQAIEGDSNIDPMKNLINVLKGADVAAVIHWLEEHAPVVWLKSEGVFRINKSQVGKMHYDPLYLMGKAWWEKAIKPKNVNSSIDFMEQLQDFIKRMEREVKKGEKEIGHQEVLTELRAVAGKLAQKEIQ